jgi:hypothetical protein
MITAESLEQAVEQLPPRELAKYRRGLLNLMRMLGMHRLKDAVTEPNRIVRTTGQSEQHVLMTAYRGAQVPGGTWFFTVSLATDKVGGAMSQE